MTSVEALNRLQTLLDDPSSDHWTSTEIYSALTDGQNAFIKEALARFKIKRSVNPSEPIPEVLRVLLTSAKKSRTDTLPKDYLLWVDVYTSTEQIKVREKSAGYSARKFNTYLQSSSDQPYCSITATQIVMETAVNYTFEYLKKPSDINSTNSPTLDDVAMNAVIHYAYAFLLKKDKRASEANASSQIYNHYVNQLY
jgi:hypothetical protein